MIENKYQYESYKRRLFELNKILKSLDGEKSFGNKDIAIRSQALRFREKLEFEIKEYGKREVIK